MCKSLNRNGQQCRNRAADSTGYCKTHHSDASIRASTGKDFEVQVLKILRLLGYKVEVNVNINGCQIDVYGEFKTGVLTLKIMVECKDYGDGKTVGIDEIAKFAGALAVARNNGVVDKGLFVTTVGFTAPAKVNARAAGIELTTYAELSTQLVDFDEYIDQLIEEYEDSPIKKYYVDLSGTEEEDYEGEAQSSFYRPIDDHLSRRLDDKACKKIALLGNFGTGKSTFCRKYSCDLAKKYKGDKTLRIPVVINLSDYDARFHIQQLILNTLQMKYRVNITLQICQELQHIGRFLLLFDGLDEMATKVDPDTIRENLRELNKVSHVSENKYIVTCRTHFFRNQVQAEMLDDFETLYIPEWGETEMQEYLTKFFGAEWKSHFERIIGTHNLPELAQTPLFLNMIVETLPRLGDKVQRVELYRAYTDNWIKAQSIRRGARLNPQERKLFVSELSVRLYCEGHVSCHYSEFASILRERFEIDDAAQMDYLRSDVQTCTFLTRDALGNYAFRHKSFMEFFVAQAVADEIDGGSNHLLGVKILPLEIRSFLVDYLQANPPADLFKQWLEESDSAILRDNVLSLLSRLKIDIADTRLQTEQLESSETQIAARFIQGETEAFDALYSTFRVQVAWIVKQRIQDPALVEDIVMDTFFAAWRFRDRLDRVGDIRKYLMQIARNKSADAARREKSRRDKEVSYEEAFFSESSDLWPHSPEMLVSDSVSAVEQRDIGNTLTQALDTLSVIERHVILAVYAEERSSTVIGRELGMQPASVAKIRLRAIEKLKRHMKTNPKYWAGFIH